ncbi:LysR family transcriptional regulator [Phascolarctobacterium succinatutens]|uniref:LysR family transcriptional regulator n=1 Tax=Phascolarctobacterium succinatutens TaxID=626940 RepID=UPI003AB08CE4
MNFDQLKYFLTIVKTGSFSEAADEMFISQSSMSKQIKALEHELGIDLFKREHSKIYLTSAGKKFLDYAQNTIKDHNDIRLYLDEFVKKSSKTIRIRSIPVVSAYGVSERIAEFTTFYTSDVNVIIDMHESSQDDVQKELKENKIDLALIRTEFLENIDEFEVIPYLDDVFVLACSKNHPLSKNKEVSLKDAAQYPLSLLSPSSKLYTIVVKAMANQGLYVKPNCLTTRHKILLEIVQKSDSISILPDRLVDTKIFPNIITINLKEDLHSSVAWVRKKEQRVNAIAKEFWNYWKQYYNEEA